MELRPYQKEAKEAIFEQWDSGVLKTLLVLPTGCGKTVVFAKVTEECVRQGDRVLILAHRGELLEQAAMVKLKDVSWMSINLQGSVASVELKERDVPPEAVPMTEPCNLKASYPGQVVRLEVISGVMKDVLEL